MSEGVSRNKRGKKPSGAKENGKKNLFENGTPSAEETGWSTAKGRKVGKRTMQALGGRSTAKKFGAHRSNVKRVSIQEGGKKFLIRANGVQYMKGKKGL